MVRIGAAQISTRLACAAMFALLLALRSLAPAGFMPAFGSGSVTIVACPDVGSAPAMPMRDHSDHKGLHQPCPYASASALGALRPDWVPFAVAILFVAALLLGASFLFVERRYRRDLPPAIGPPIPA